MRTSCESQEVPENRFQVHHLRVSDRTCFPWLLRQHTWPNGFAPVSLGCITISRVSLSWPGCLQLSHSSSDCRLCCSRWNWCQAPLILNLYPLIFLYYSCLWKILYCSFRCEFQGLKLLEPSAMSCYEHCCFIHIIYNIISWYII